MEASKTCGTNVCVIQNVLQIPVAIYDISIYATTDSISLRPIFEILTYLRTHGVLCNLTQTQLWIFGEVPAYVGGVLRSRSETFRVMQSGTMETTVPVSKCPPMGVLVQAIEALLAFRLATCSGFVHLGSGIWLRNDTVRIGPSTEPITMQLRTSFTSSGSLYIMPEIRTSSEKLNCGIAKACGINFYLAPYRLLASSSTESSAHPVSSNAWKSYVTHMLLSEGVSITDNEAWEAVHLADVSGNYAFLWPATLCIQRATKTSCVSNHMSDHHWLRWFSSTMAEESFTNPLSAAEEWLRASSDRQKEADVITLEKSNDSASNDGPFGTNYNASTRPELLTAISPQFIQRATDCQVAIGGVYPTPPDVPNQGSSLPTINLTSDTMHTVPHTQTEAMGHASELNLSADDSHFLSSRRNSTLAQEGILESSADAEFGENDIGDADFSFFDDPSDEQRPQEPDISSDYIIEEDNLCVLNSFPGIPGTQAAISTQAAGNLGQGTSANETQASPLPTISNATEIISNAGSGSGKQFPKPLSPFGIRELLLPPPIPASIAHSQIVPSAQLRKNGAFGPITFRENFDLKSKYSSALASSRPAIGDSDKGYIPNVRLPPPRKRPRNQKRRDFSSPTTFMKEGNGGGEGSSDSSDSCSDDGHSSQMTFDQRKRKRRTDFELTPLAGSLERMWPLQLPDEESPESSSVEELITIFQRHVLGSGSPCDFVKESPTNDYQNRFGSLSRVQQWQSEHQEMSSLQKVDELHSLSKHELVSVAQIISEQAVSAFWINLIDPPTLFSSAAFEIMSDENLFHQQALAQLERIATDNKACDLTEIALIREPHPTRAMPQIAKGQPGQPRPTPRPDPTSVGPDILSLPTPYVRVRRGNDDWEMLPTCLSFWETLGLEPANGTKDVSAICIFPNNVDLEDLVKGFMNDLNNVYEGCKLGLHAMLKHNLNENSDARVLEDGMAPVELDHEITLASAIKAYSQVCSDIGKALSSANRFVNRCTFVVYMFNPFIGLTTSQHLCACFATLFKAYRNNLPRSIKSVNACDIVLQLIPLSLVASPDSLVLQEAHTMALLAREVYDRCPPNGSIFNSDHSALPIAAAASIELASPIPKRIGFQLIAEPPSDLLLDGSALHLAYARSKDGQWLTATWCDNFGQNLGTTAFCLCGRSFVDVIEEVWERTRDIISARRITWRIFIVCDDVIEAAVSRQWRRLASKPRQQAICVTLLSAETNPALRFTRSTANPETSASGAFGLDASFLTPASTPQGANMTNSPDVRGDAAPLTPAPSETATLVTETDPDAQLVDLTDEIWATVISPRLAKFVSINGTANGALFKRGEPASTTSDIIPSFIVSLHWTIHVKPNGNVDEGNIKQAELTLRELLRMFRNLALLTRARGLSRPGMEIVPLHIAVAAYGARGLDTMLSHIPAS